MKKWGRKNEVGESGVQNESREREEKRKLGVKEGKVEEEDEERDEELKKVGRFLNNNCNLILLSDIPRSFHLRESTFSFPEAEQRSIP